jgi:transcriptional regulator with XRE-family HTH domain
MSLGKRLKELREAAGHSQAQLAKLTGVSRNAVSQWEANVTQPSTRRLAQVARALNVPIDQIMAPSTEMRDRTIAVATRLFDQLGADAVSVDIICATAEMSRSQFDTHFGSKEGLLCEVARALADRAFAELRRNSPRYGTLLTRLKYTLRHLLAHDLAHINIAGAMSSYSWRWAEQREREHNRNLLEFHDVIIALFDNAAAYGEINSGNFRAASGLVLAAYQAGLRKAVHERSDADDVISLIEPQLTIILNGFGFREIPGLSEDER